MPKQTMAFEPAVELLFKGEMLLISGRVTGEKTLRSSEDSFQCHPVAKVPTNKQLWKLIVEDRSLMNAGLLPVADDEILYLLCPGRKNTGT